MRKQLDLSEKSAGLVVGGVMCWLCTLAMLWTAGMATAIWAVVKLVKWAVES